MRQSCHLTKFILQPMLPYVFMRRFLKAAESDQKLELLSFFLIELCLVEYEMLKFPPSFTVAAAIFTAQCTLYGVKQWSTMCEFIRNTQKINFWSAPDWSWDTTKRQQQETNRRT